MRRLDIQGWMGHPRLTAVVVAAAALLLFAFLTYPTIDADEGYFFHGGVNALSSGRPGFPWADALYGRPHLYIPLNSLDTLANWPLAYLPQPLWLVCGRLLSALVVCLGVLLLYLQRREKATTHAGIWIFLATCLPLILMARVIRPDGFAFLGICCALALAPVQRRVAAFAAGLVIALVVLTHVIHGGLAAVTIFGLIIFSPATSAGTKTQRALIYCFGAAVPVAIFYLVYALFEEPSAILQDMNILLASAPRYVTSLSPLENVVAWVRHMQGQANLWPLLLFTSIAILTPSGKGGDEAAATRYLKAALLGILFFWIFIYPKKAFTIVVLLLPIAVVVLCASRTRPWPRLATWGLVVCLAANTVLVARYHWRLLQLPDGYEQVAAIAAELERQYLSRPGVAVLGKLWLVFSLPPNVVLWDITAFPMVLGEGSGRDAGIAAAVARSDAVVLEWQAGEWGDDLQAEMAKYLAKAGWRQVSVPIARYFQPQEAQIFLPP